MKDRQTTALQTMKMNDNTFSSPLQHPNSDSALINGVNFLLALLEFPKQSPGPAAGLAGLAGFSAASYAAGSIGSDGGDATTPEEEEKQRRILSATLSAVAPRVADFTELLLNPPAKATVKTTAGVLDPPLGATRLNVAKLVAALLATNSAEINDRFREHNTIDILLVSCYVLKLWVY